MCDCQVEEGNGLPLGSVCGGTAERRAHVYGSADDPWSSASLPPTCARHGRRRRQGGWGRHQTEVSAFPQLANENYSLKCNY